MTDGTGAAKTATIGEVIDRLKQLADHYGYHVPLFVRDADTEWRLPVHPVDIEAGDDGKRQIIIFNSLGYHGEYDDKEPTR